MLGAVARPSRTNDKRYAKMQGVARAGEEQETWSEEAVSFGVGTGNPKGITQLSECSHSAS